MNKKIRFFALVTVMLLIFVSFQMTAFAAEALDSDMDCTLSIYYKYDSTAIANSKFEIYRAADRTDYSGFQLIEPFSSYPIEVGNQDKTGWEDAALALSGYVSRDQVTPIKTGVTDGNGKLIFDELKPGLYLIVSSRCVQGNSAYSSSPFFVALPGLDFSENVWEQSISVEPKCIKDVIEDTGITRRVIKIWDDKGYETIRPDEISVQLLCDGKVHDTVELCEDNQWSYSWENLDADYNWIVVEKEPTQYAVTANRQGTTFIITNRYVVPVSEKNLVISKKINGDRPNSESTFTFVLSGKDASCPMPAGCEGLKKELNIKGAGNIEIDDFKFEKPGTYIYTISEKNRGAEGYTYDSSTYTITYKVSQKGKDLSINRSISDSKGNEVDIIEFVNGYKTPGKKLPQTGLLWWPVPILLSVGLALCVVGIMCRKRRIDE